jgi:hypothetical protein
MLFSALDLRQGSVTGRIGGSFGEVLPGQRLPSVSRGCQECWQLYHPAEEALIARLGDVRASAVPASW